MAKWIEFDEIPSDTRKTRAWFVKGKEDGAVLGEVKWFGRFRQYSFFPWNDTVYERQCLRDIADFCEGETQKHRASKVA